MDRHKKKWYKAEGKMLDDLYRERMADWQKLYDKYELNFQGKVRDLEAEDVVRVNRFYPIVRQILGTIAHNYPVQKFSVEDETASPTAEILERTAAAWMNVVDLKPHVHQAIFDALFCGVGWIRLDYNPPGDKDIIALDNGIYKIWYARNYKAYEPNTVLLDNALATMGAGLPSAMAAAALHPDRRIMAICGDGGFMMNSQELETAIRMKLNLVVLVLNDSSYGMIRWKQAALGLHSHSTA